MEIQIKDEKIKELSRELENKKQDINNWKTMFYKQVCKNHHELKLVFKSNFSVKVNQIK